MTSLDSLIEPEHPARNHRLNTSNDYYKLKRCNAASQSQQPRLQGGVLKPDLLVLIVSRVVERIREQLQQCLHRNVELIAGTVSDNVSSGR